MMAELKYPGPDDDWSTVYSVVRETVEKWLGRERLEEKWVQDGGDNSLLPVAKEDRNEIIEIVDDGGPEPCHTIYATLHWKGEDKFSDLLDSPNGQTTATYVSGHGLTCEYVVGELQAAVHHEIYRLCEAKNPGVDDPELFWDWCHEESQTVLGDYDNSTLNDVIADCKEREKSNGVQS